MSKRTALDDLMRTEDERHGYHVHVWTPEEHGVGPANSPHSTSHQCAVCPCGDYRCEHREETDRWAR